MMNIRPRFLLALLAASLSTTTSLCAQVVNTPQGLVEFVGLHRWTIEMILDSMRVHAPGKALGQCAGVLRDLGFPSAQSLALSVGEGPRPTLVVVVEPQDSARVRLRPVSHRSRKPVALWATGYDLLRDHPRAFADATEFFSVHLSKDTALERQVLESSPTDSAAVRATWNFLDGRRSKREGALARERLMGDSSIMTRRLAAAVLMEHATDVRAWYALVEALTVADDRTAAAADVALRALTAGRPRRIDWTPEVGALRAILDGTNVLALEGTMVTLARTGVAPTLARRLVAGGGDLPLAYLASGSPRHRAAAHGFLMQIAGRDFGDDPAPWRRWIASLD